MFRAAVFKKSMTANKNTVKPRSYNFYKLLFRLQTLLYKKTDPPLTLGGSVFCDLLFCFLDFRSLSRKTSQIIEFSSSYLTCSYNGHVRNLGGMDGETAFYAYAERKTANGKRFADTAVFLCDDNALEVLDSLLAALDNAVTDFVPSITLKPTLTVSPTLKAGTDSFIPSFSIASMRPFMTLPPVLRDVHSRSAAEERPKSFAIIA